ncbi:ABC transporter ATP-binding protein [Clostridium oryzae]|uniref:Putative multidrug resistance ABC transporter ATP-binding/permease protein YheH n=1 Tax=Clostridium oryzae TaxID=1450648 RepID=A0A1V4IRG2_9CLOT|nr:ABC transporter ATP-binding protein [Clostridium oryzae]OPJ62400.1 putative multidrug resistance ABC transporter ATP-binding/permease protein YheH [Clostridium oryzae]
MIFIKNKKKTANETSYSNSQKDHGFFRLLMLTKPHIKKVIIAAICVILVNIAELVKPYILKLVIDDFLIKRVKTYGFYSINLMAFLYLTVVVGSSVFSVMQANIINAAAQDIMKDLRKKVFKTIQLLPLWYLDKVSSGRLITRATNDVEALSEMYTDVIINLFKDVFFIIGIVYAMVSLNIELAMISFILLPIMAFIVVNLKNKIKNNFTKMKALIGRINGFMSENISGMKIIQIFIGEKEKYQEFKKLNDEYFVTTKYQVWINSFLKPASEIFKNISIAILVWYGMNKIGNHTLQIGVLYAFTTYIQQFFNPISDLADNYTTIQSALVSASRIFELLDTEESLEKLDNGEIVPSFQGTVEFKNVWFAYNDENWVLRDVSFKIERGETAAFVGETGAGKTTIISLISGFYNIQKGQILIDGKDITHIALKSLRRNVAVVLQDVFLFSGDIAENIKLNDNITDEVVKEAVKLSCASDFVNNMENGINEKVMERGSTFSAGQRQLISFARAIAHDPSILVLDEATANIDTFTEKLIQEAIENISQNRTTLVIAHRLSTIRNADKIIVMHDGKISEMGNHHSLMQKKGYYYDLIVNGES